MRKRYQLVGSEGEDAEHAMAHHLAGATDSNMAATEQMTDEIRQAGNA